MINRGTRAAALMAGMLLVSLAIATLLTLLTLPALIPAGTAAREASRYWQQLPATLVEPPLPARSVMLDVHGHEFASFYAYDRIPVPATRMAPVLRRAVVASEDARFYQHNGYDPVGIARALASNASSGGGLQGASTITQQYVKNVLALQAELGSTSQAAEDATAVSVTRKIRELKLAIGVTRELSKDEVLTRYLNIAYFGSGAYGVEAAARRYFSLPAAKLNATQAATLTALLKNPTGYDPLEHPATARERRNIVLGRMRDQAVITPAAYTRDVAKPLGTHPHTPHTGCAYSTYPFYCEQVLHLLRDDPAFGPTDAARAQMLAIGGLRITTPLDPHAMAVTNAAAKSTIPAGHRVATAVVVVKPGTGDVVGMATNRYYGSGDAAHTEIVLPTTPAFQPGSTFKMFTLVTALNQGLPISTRLPGGTTYTSHVLNNPAKGYYSNSAGSASNVTLSTAAQMSMNTAFVQLEEKVGVPAIAEMAHRLGVTTTGPTGPGAPAAKDGSYTLGTALVSVSDMANAYATVASGGIGCPATFIRSVVTANGTHLDTPGDGCHRVLDEAVAHSVGHILSTVITQGTGSPAAFGRPAAGKTGTTENLGAAWFAGFTPQYATAVWVGDPTGSSHSLVNVLGYSHVYGGTLPATVWRKTMLGVHEGLPVVPLPPADPSYVMTSSGALTPDVVGTALVAARARLHNAGLPGPQIRWVARTAGQAAGVVVAQSPAPGSALPDTGAGEAPAAVTLSVTR